MFLRSITEVTSEGIKISRVNTEISEMEGERYVHSLVTDGAVLLLKQKMTAMELINVSQFLREIASELVTNLAMACGPCDPCDGCEDHCPFDDLDEEAITLPGYLREEAGIPENAKLCACVDEKNGAVIISAAEHEHDLSDVPEFIIDVMVNCGVCFGRLEEHLIKGDIVYD